MKVETKFLLQTLESYLQKNFNKFKRKYPSVSGAYIFKKNKNGVRKNRYAIVFTVTEKIKDLPPSKKIPAYLNVTVPGYGVKKVPTDIIESGNAELCTFRPGCPVYNTATPLNRGTCGCIGYRNKNGKKEYYLISNMHVLGSCYFSLTQYIKNGECFVKNEGASLPADVCRQNFIPGALFEQGIFSDRMDAAIARITTQEIPDNEIYSKGIPVSMLCTDPWPVYPKLLEVQVYGSVSYNFPRGTVEVFRASQSFASPIPGYHTITINNLLKIDGFRCEKGDSGAPVFFESEGKIFIAGIVLGRDKSCTYAIPIMTILKTFKLNIGL